MIQCLKHSEIQKIRQSDWRRFLDANHDSASRFENKYNCTSGFLTFLRNVRTSPKTSMRLFWTHGRIACLPDVCAWTGCKQVVFPRSFVFEYWRIVTFTFVSAWITRSLFFVVILTPCRRLDDVKIRKKVENLCNLNLHVWMIMSDWKHFHCAIYCINGQHLSPIPSEL